jgi:hypothetical protein
MKELAFLFHTEKIMTFGSINYLSIFVAALAGFGFGAVYYMTLATPWMNASGWSADEQAAKAKAGMGGSKTPFIIAIIANLVMAWILAGLIGHLGPGQATVRNGLISGAFCWLGFVMTTQSVNYAFGGRKPSLTVIDGGHWLGVLLIMGAVIGALGS